MKAKEFIEDWYDKPIPPDWDLEYEPLQNLSINDLEKMLKQYTLHIAEQAVEDEIKNANTWTEEACAKRILSRIKTLTKETE